MLTKFDKKLTTGARRQAIIEKMKLVGSSNIEITNLAHEFRVSRQTIYNDLQAIGERFDVKRLNDLRLCISTGLESGMRRMLHVVHSSDSTHSERIAALSAFAKASGQLLRLLELYDTRKIVEPVAAGVSFAEVEERIRQACQINRGV